MSYPTFIQPEPIRRSWAIRLAVGLVLLGACLNLFSLWHNPQFGLVDDEAHYYLWSQHLDYGYYSKPPGIAWVMRGAEQVGQFFGIEHATAPVLRSAAVLFSILTGLLSIALTRRMFRDDRAALMVTVLSAAAPMFVVGALLITIDSPMYLCWAAGVYCLWRAVEPSAPIENQKAKSKNPTLWLYLAGIVVSLGMMFKPVLIAIPICAAVASIANWQIRRRLINRHGLIALGITLLSQVPVLIWNANHNWVTFRHLSGQAGMKGGEAGEGAAPFWEFPKRMAIYIGGQAGGMAGILFILMLIAIVIAWRQAKSDGPLKNPVSPVFPFLISFTVPLWIFYLLLNLTTTSQINWPAASYFTGMILLAGVATGFWADHKHRDHRAWKGWIIGAMVWGLMAAIVTQNLQWFYPLAKEHLPALNDARYEKSWWHPRHWDVALRLREAEPRAAAVQMELDAMTAATGRVPTVVSVRYNISSSLTFYLSGRPFVYCIGPWVGARQSQYDIWPGLNEKDSAGHLVHAGEDVLLVGDTSPADDAMIKTAFTRVEEAQMKPVMLFGINLRSIRIQKCYGFQGLPVTSGGGSF